jgi:steroid 5-alpha reductase family enzyme
VGGFPVNLFLVNVAASAALVAALFAGVFVVSVLRDRHDTLDPLWGLAFPAIAVLTFFLSHGHGNTLVRMLVTALTLAWGLRLAVHLGVRSAASAEDPRYVKVRNSAGAKSQLYLVRRLYLVQAGGLLVISLPVQAAQYGSDASAPVLVAGAVLWLVGFVFETVSDWQLARFRADPTNDNRVMDRGLWRYSRHPNYFGDICVWWGLFLLACNSWVGVATVVSPLLMTYVLVCKTGKPMLENRLLQRRPGYADYIARTSSLVPWPPSNMCSD